MASSASTPKVVLSRKLPAKLLSERAQRGEIELVEWHDESRGAERSWLLENVKGAQGIVVMLNDKVSSNPLRYNTAQP